MRHLDRAGVHASLWVAGIWLAWWFACRPASADALQRLGERMTRDHGSVPAQQFAQRLGEQTGMSLFGAWRAFVEVSHGSRDAAGTALATALLVLVDP